MPRLRFCATWTGLTLIGALAAPAEGLAAPARRGPKPVAFAVTQLDAFFAKPPLAAAAARLRAGDPEAAIAAFSKALRRPRAPADERRAAETLLAIAQMRAERWRVAQQSFERLWRVDPLLRPYHAYHVARCALRAGDAREALTWSERVEDGAVMEAETRLVRLDALAALRRFTDLEAEARAYLERFWAGPRRAEAGFARARALDHLGQLPEAVRAYRLVWSTAPLERWSAQADARLAELRAATPTLDVAATASEWTARGRAWLDAQRNTQGEADLTTALAQPQTSAAQTCQAHYYRAQAVWKQRQRARALPLYTAAEAACRAAADEDLLVKSLYQRGRCLASTGDRAGARAAYAALERDHAGHSYADDARVRAAELEADAGDRAAADARLAELPRLYPHGDQVGEALWRSAFRAYEAGEFARVRGLLDETRRLIPRATEWFAEGRAEYWTARAFAREGRDAEAQEWYERAARLYPLSYYALLAFERLQAAPGRAQAVLRQLRRGLPPPPPRAGAPVSRRPRVLYGDPAFKRAVTLARMGLVDEAHREIVRLNLRLRAEASADDAGIEDLQWILSAILDRAGRFGDSHRVPRLKLTAHRLAYPSGLGAQKWRLSYPRAFASLVDQHAPENGVPRALEFAVMREESAFDPRSESPANCLGLTMLKPSTAAELHGAPLDREALWDPATNVRLGARFLGGMLRRFAGMPALAIASYNAGMGAVGRWQREKAGRPLDEFVESIPFEETRGYTKRVLASYFAYTWLYEKAPVPAARLTEAVPAPPAARVPAPAAADADGEP